MKYAILIDAGFLKRKLGSQAEPLDVHGVCSFAAPDLEPNIHQKGVDMRLGLDIAAITLKGHADVFVLVAGDSDFVPAMKFARREGAQLFLVTLGHSVRAEMLEHSDLVLEVPTRPASVVPSSLVVRETMGTDARGYRAALPVD
jgi:uncharacterized LabA/DUF88 family protein